MKKINIISLITIFSLFLYSCDEDDVIKVQDDENKMVELSPNAFDYLFKENSTYTYLENGSEQFDGVNNEVHERIRNIKTLEYFNVNNRNSIEIGQSRFLSADSNAIYSHGDFFYLSQITFNRYDWLLIFDFTKDNWTIFDNETIIDSSGNILKNENSHGQKLKEIEFEFKNVKYKGYEFVLETNTTLKFYNKDNELELNEVTKVKETIHLVNSLGMVFYSLNYNFKELISGKENKIETVSILKEIKQN